MSEDGIRSKDNDLIEAIRALQAEGSIRLQASPSPRSYLNFLIGLDKNWWIFAIIGSSLVEVPLVVSNVQSGPVWVLRVVIGLGLLGFIPGYSTIQILFPGNRLNSLEQALMSIVLSLTISIATGVALGAGYHFSGASNVIILCAYAGATALVAGYRRYSLVRTVKAGSG